MTDGCKFSKKCAIIIINGTCLYLPTPHPTIILTGYSPLIIHTLSVGEYYQTRYPFQACNLYESKRFSPCFLELLKLKQIKWPNFIIFVQASTYEEMNALLWYLSFERGGLTPCPNPPCSKWCWPAIINWWQSPEQSRAWIDLEFWSHTF